MIRICRIISSDYNSSRQRSSAGICTMGISGAGLLLIYRKDPPFIPSARAYSAPVKRRFPDACVYQNAKERR
jgi:hypothetical protein